MPWYQYVSYFFGGAFLAKRDSTLRKRNDGPLYSESLCQAAGQRSVFLDHKRAVGSVQHSARLLADSLGFTKARGPLAPGAKKVSAGVPSPAGVDIPATLPPMPPCSNTAFAIFRVSSGNL